MIIKISDHGGSAGSGEQIINVHAFSEGRRADGDTCRRIASGHAKMSSSSCQIIAKQIK